MLPILRATVDVYLPLYYLMKALHQISWILVIIGGINWLLLAVLDWEIGQLFGGMDAMISKIIYILVGLAALYLLIMKFMGKSHRGPAPMHSNPPMGGSM